MEDLRYRMYDSKFITVTAIYQKENCFGDPTEQEPLFMMVSFISDLICPFRTPLVLVQCIITCTLHLCGFLNTIKKACMYMRRQPCQAVIKALDLQSGGIGD